MQVGFALLTLTPGKVGGSESYAAALLNQYADGNGPAAVTTLANSGVVERYSHLERGPVSFTKLGQTPSTRPALRLLQLAANSIPLRRVSAGRFSLIHYPLTVPVPHFAGKRTVVTLHDVRHLELPQTFRKSERIYRKIAYDRSARKADAVITVSEYARTTAIEHLSLDPDRVFAVHHGIDHNRFNPTESELDHSYAQQLKLPARFVFYPANLWPHKNHRRLVAAFAKAAVANEIKLVLTGAIYGQEADLNRSLTKHKLENRVTHLGYVPDQALPSLYRLAEAVVFPSLYEGFGQPPIEAMACGCPVAASATTALKEVCGDAALTIDPYDERSIASAIESVTSDTDLRKRLRTIGLQRAKLFSWRDSARAHTELYRRIAGA